MKPLTKNVSIPISIYLLTGLCGCTPSFTINNINEQVFYTASEIADFELPLGYVSNFSATKSGYSIVAFNLGDGHSHLYMIQSINKKDGEKLTSILGQNAPGTRMKVIETRPVTVRGHDETLVISEGTTSEGDVYRQVALVFQGKGGPALLVFSEPDTSWDQDSVDAFIASIH